MATEDDVQEAIDGLEETIAEEADDTYKWTQEQSAEIFEGVAAGCEMRARTIRQEMER